MTSMKTARALLALQRRQMHVSCKPADLSALDRQDTNQQSPPAAESAASKSAASESTTWDQASRARRKRD